LGVAVIAIIWGGIYLLASREHARAYEDAVRQGSNLTRVLEEYIRRIACEADASLLTLRRAYQAHPDDFDIAAWAKTTQPNNDMTVQFGISSAAGFIKESTQGPVTTPIYVGDRPHFQFQVEHSEDQLYISAPIIGRITQKKAIQFSRRLSKPDGAFDGVVVTSVDVQHLQDFFSSLDTGHGGVVSLVGLDGIMRARGGIDPGSERYAGVAVTKSPVFTALQEGADGHYWNTTNSSAHFDNIIRLISYRAIAGFPLVAVVGMARDQIFLQSDETLRHYLIVGTMLTIIVLAVMALGAAGRSRLLSANAELKRSKQSLEQSNSRFTAALQNMSQGLCMFNAEHRILVANERYRQIYNLPEELVKPCTAFEQIVDYRRGSGNYSGTDPAEYIAAQFRNSTEVEKLGNGRVIMILRHAMADGCWLTTHEDITERWRTETRVAYLAHHDALTGLANRPALVEKIEDACSRYRWRGEEFNVLMIDLDRFKQVNDTFGHPSGDELLKQVAERLKGALAANDVLARLGGDEFAIIQFDDSKQTDAAEALAADILALVAEPFSIGGIDVGIGASIGIALAPDHGTHADELLKKADLALYHAKSSGRNRYAIFESALGQAAVQKHTLENELRRALARKEFEVCFQPIVDTKTLKMRAAETLIRWRHPERGLIPPDEFIPLAEETGTILQIGEWVLEAACREAVTWPASVKVAVNLSAVQLRSSTLLDYVMCVLVESGLPPERLEFEVTETALIEQGAECIALLRKLKNLGITVALDDFGTGYSSLNQLTMFPFDKIKIDKSFTRDMTNRADCAAIISAVLALAHSLDIETTAEGVETEDQLRILRMAGVSTVQGYLIQKPCAPADLRFDGYHIVGAIDDAA
jgi:diguanylate cyclase (GGDEF)-like protein